MRFPTRTLIPIVLVTLWIGRVGKVSQVNLQNYMYEDFDKVKEAVEVLKVKFMESGPRFTGRMEIF
jgi:hypothetical protein